MGSKKDFTGMRFGNLIVEKLIRRDEHSISYWDCRCDCGNHRIVSRKELVSGKVISCGCKNKTTFMDLTGKKFGKLLVLSFGYKERQPNGKFKYYWKCKCDCGNTKYIIGNSLRRGLTKTCGCSHTQVEDLTGRRFGKLTVVDFLHTDKDGQSWWRCKCDCGNYTDLPRGRLLNNNTKSCGCLSHELYKKHRVYPQKFIDELMLDTDKERALTGEIGCDEDLWFMCPHHGKYKQTVHNKISITTGEYKSGCPACANAITYFGSQSELEIKGYIQSITNTKCEKARILKIDDSHTQEIDIYLPEYNLGIEYNGSVFHATINGAYDNKDKLYHQKKFLCAKEQGIHLINIFDVDWNNNKDKIKMYLKSLLTPSTVIQARKCCIECITKELANEFTDKYHLQGRCNLSTIHYGLYYNNELLAVMSFGNLRYKEREKHRYELYRYCVKDNYLIIGGANKLLKAFEREYTPKYLRSYSNNDYFTGGIYSKLGFSYVKQCTVTYYWFMNGVELKRGVTQVVKLKKKYPDIYKESLQQGAKSKETYIMTKLDARKVYRSGNTLWEKCYDRLERSS